MNIREALSEAVKNLKEAGISEPNASAEVLLSDLLGLSRTELIAKNEQEMTKKELKKYQVFVERRKKHEPVWQIIGKVDFWGMSYVVNKNVLVPRPETEILVKEVLKYAKSQDRALKILDLGTGSGTVVCALQNELKNCSFSASDVSSKALKVAKLNAKRLTQRGSIKFKKGDLFKPWKGEKFDIVVANLPYIPHKEIEGLALDVYHHEPRVALDGGKHGLEIYRRFFQELPNRLESHAAVFVEIGIDQGDDIKAFVAEYLPNATCEILGDLAGIDRVGIIRVK